jgi:hypothetical protein
MATAKEMARQWGAKAATWVKRGGAEAKEVALATGGHAARLKRFGTDQWQLRRLAAREIASRAALGARLHALGWGDAAQRGRIDQLLERIRSLEAAKASAKPVHQELRAEQARLGEMALEQPSAPSGAEDEFDAAKAAREAMAKQQAAAAQSQAAVRPADRQQAWRIGGGYAIASLLLVAAVWGMSSSGGTQSDRSMAGPGMPAPGAGDNEGGGNGGGGIAEGDGFPNTPVPPAQGTPVYQPPREQACTLCYGTGQANCSACFGTGKRTCYTCNGRGQQPNPANNFQQLMCFQCQGTGKQNCSFCQYGKVHCPQCFGSGRTRG